MPPRHRRRVTAAAFVLLVIGAFASGPTSAAPVDSRGQAPALQAICADGLLCFSFTADLDGNGSGSLVSTTNGAPNGLIHCTLLNGVKTSDSICSRQYKDFGFGITVNYTVTPATGSTACFLGTCYSSPVESSINLIAVGDFVASWTFTRDTEMLSVSIQGPGRVLVGGVTCSDFCIYPILYGTHLFLTAAPDSGTAFAGWTGACAGQGPSCQFTITSDQFITAKFGPATYGLHVVVNGSGTVTSSPAVVTCTSSGGSGCNAAFQTGTDVRLTAAAPSGWAFSYWGADCVGQDATCDLRLDSDKTASAFFVKAAATPPPATPRPTPASATATPRPSPTQPGNPEPGVTPAPGASAGSETPSSQPGHPSPGAANSPGDDSPAPSGSPTQAVEGGTSAGEGSFPWILAVGVLTGGGIGVIAARRRRQTREPEEPVEP